METGRVEELLEEIRDLKTAHLDLYRDALANQRGSIRIQEEAVRHQRLMMRVATVVVLPLLALVVGVLIWLLRAL